MKEIVLKRLKEEEYMASYAWCNMRDAKDKEMKDAMHDSWVEHKKARWICHELLEAAGVSKKILWEIEEKEAERAYEDYEEGVYHV